MKRIIALLLALILICGLIPSALATQGPAVSYNQDYHWYVNAFRWATPIFSHLSYENNQYVRAECIYDELVVETYDQNFNFLSGKSIPLELPIFGGVRMDRDYNFVVVGQENFQEDDSREVFRIIRYTKDWKKVDHASIYGANTTIPFDAGSLRFDRSGDILYIRTAHEMYTTPDGINHQANVMIALRISDMTVTDQLTNARSNSYGYVSHSFNQFVRVDGDTLLAVDHGDAHPRSVCLFKYSKAAGSETFYGKTSMVNALPIVDSTYSYNDTGVAVGGFEFSSTDYLIAGSSYDQKEPADLVNVQQNIFVTATPKNNFTDEGTQINWITHFSESDDVFVSPPHLLKLSSDRFLLTWTEDDVLKYCFLNGKGQLDSVVSTHEGHLSDCAPILVGSNAVWYVTADSAPVFWQIGTDVCAHSYTSQVTAPTCTAGGYTTYTCTHCDHSYKGSQTAALGHSWSGTVCTRCGITRLTPFDDVKPGSFCEEPVAWAVARNITTGMSATSFAPDNPCTRGQVVTFLWRAAGMPEPQSSENPFVDLRPGSFYEKAVLWAVEAGITKGTDATHFSPDAPCNRSSVVTFLWRAAGTPAPQSTANPFVDVKAGSFYEKAVFWAVEQDITKGTDATHFSPDKPCTRGQVVTFLYRAFR